MPMKIIRIPGVAVILFLVALMLPGCVTARKGEPASVPTKETRASYYDFDDILIPSELSLDKKNSLIYTTGRLKAGILVLGGRVEPASLASFFQNNMQKDGWSLLSSFKYRQYLLVFLKEDRVCVIMITEKTFSTAAEVRVGPIEQGVVSIKGPQPR
jgi:hypothetical protein